MEENQRAAWDQRRVMLAAMLESTEALLGATWLDGSDEDLQDAGLDFCKLLRHKLEESQGR